ncbi:exported hypothetical protein [Gammaproteobacteria bacterium]
MRFIFIALLFALSAWALDDITVPNTFQDSAVIEADDFNDNFDTLEAWAARLNDSLNTKWMRWTNLSSHDSTISYLRVDSIRSNPDIDSIKGHPYIDTITTKKITTDTIVTSKIRTTDIEMPGGTLSTFSRGTFGIKITTGACTAESTTTCNYMVLDSIVFLTFPNRSGIGGLFCTSNTTSLSLYPTTSFPAAILPTESFRYVPCIVINNGDQFPGEITVNGSLGYWPVYTVRDGAGADVAGLDIYTAFVNSGAKGVVSQTIIYKR